MLVIMCFDLGLKVEGSRWPIDRKKCFNGKASEIIELDINRFWFYIVLSPVS